MRSIAMITICALALVTPAFGASGASARVETQPYVAQWTAPCSGITTGWLYDEWARDPANELGDAWLGEPLSPEAPERPSIMPDEEVSEQPCFPVAPGDTMVTLRVRDDVADFVRYWVGIGDSHETRWVYSEIFCSVTDAQVPLPEGATRVAVTVYPASALGCMPEDGATVERIAGGGSIGTTGDVTATFT